MAYTQEDKVRAMAAEAERLHRNGLTNREIAFRMGVSEEIVRALRGGRR